MSASFLNLLPMMVLIYLKTSVVISHIIVVPPVVPPEGGYLRMDVRVGEGCMEVIESPLAHPRVLDYRRFPKTVAIEVIVPASISGNFVFVPNETYAAPERIPNWTATQTVQVGPLLVHTFL
jgi:hypothetical protein